ncbi:MAG: hypothetical protein KatS3mg001_073 [Candidatus Pacearchaeota archaeon]|nr:MAG: hypothetical protein KatS3mg001_073 [Candidatus Pacearchaeota archaeon]
MDRRFLSKKSSKGSRGLEEICSWEILIPHDKWERVKADINRIVKRHGEIPVSGGGRCIGKGFELYAGFKQIENCIYLNVSIRSKEVIPILLIGEINDYVMRNLDCIVSYENKFRNLSFRYNDRQ